MIHTIMEALQAWQPVRPEGQTAGKMPQLCVSEVSDQALYRADGQDYVRKIRCQVDAFALAREEAQRLFAGAAGILTRAPYGYCLENRQESFDEYTQTYRVSGRFAAAWVKEDEHGSADEGHSAYCAGQ